MKSVFFSIIMILITVFNLSYPQKTSSHQLNLNYTEKFIKENLSPVDFSQPISFLPQFDEPGFFNSAQPLQLPNNEVLMFWTLRDQNSPPTINNIKIKLSRSFDGGLNWYMTSDVTTIENNYLDSLIIMAEVSNTGRIVFIFCKSSFTQSNRFFKMFSDDNGYNWTAPALVGTGIGALGRNANLSKMNDGSLWLTYNKSTSSIGIRISNDEGNTWSSELQLPSVSYNRFYPSAFSLDSQNKAIVFQSDVSGSDDIYFLKSTDNGLSWSDTNSVVNTGTKNYQPRAVINSFGNIWIIYRADSTYTYPTWYGYQHTQSNIHCIKSTDAGISWSQPQKMTQYTGKDNRFAVKVVNNHPLVSFTSNRANLPNNYRLWYGVIEITVDSDPPPSYGVHLVTDQTATQPVQLKAIFLRTSRIVEAKVLYHVNNQLPFQEVPMYDDGLHNDGDADDDLWSAEIGPFGITDNVFYKFFLKDSVGNQIEFYGWTLSFLNYLTEGHLIDVNKFKIPVDNYGKIADVKLNGISTSGTYDDKIVLYSGGFFLSGYTNDTLWANGVMSSSHINDYLPGPVGEIPSPLHKLYIVNFDDEPFGESWQNWVNAVELGADFYDGNGDGIYNPVDLNNNGLWDFDEDHPGLIGNETVFTVFNDNMPSNLRRFFGVHSQGVEIKQTAFAFANEEYSLNNTVFVRYRITNKSLNDWNQLYFSITADPDIGEMANDLSGYDSVSRSGYAYNQGSDPVWGSSPPAFFQTLIHGPQIFIPGETYIDNNGNGVFDPGIDIPIDTAYNIRGSLMGIDTIPGAKNLQPASSTNYQSNDPFHGDPNYVNELRQYQIGGRRSNGELINPCTWQLGTVIGVNCNQVNPLFMYSGDPETQIGWLHTQQNDVRQMQSFGPFDLKHGEFTDILTAYLVGRNTSAVNSVTLTKQKALEILEAAWSNFPVTVVSVGDEEINLPAEFNLYQNYPNPFNPITKIIWQSPVGSHQVIKVFDVLGREVATLVDEFRNAGSYEVEFDGSSLASGIYFYQLKVNDFITTKKMMLLR